MAINYDIRDQLPEDAIVFDNSSYDNSIIGTTFDGRAIYDFDLMITELMEDEGWTEEEAVEWIEVNTLRAIPYAGPKSTNSCISSIGGYYVNYKKMGNA